jgi:hypothetical protein
MSERAAIPLILFKVCYILLTVTKFRRILIL